MSGQGASFVRENPEMLAFLGSPERLKGAALLGEVNHYPEGPG